MRRVRAAGFVVCAMLVAAGCFQIDVAVEVRPDGSGTAREIFAVDRRKAITGLGGRESVEEAIPRADRIENLPDWARASPYRQDGLEGVAIDLDFPAPELLGPRLKVLSEAITGTVGSRATSDVVLEREGLGWRFTARQTDLGLRPDSTIRGSEIREMYDTAEIRLTLALPGRIVSHNADRLEGNQLTWTIPVDVDDTELYAVSEPLQGAGAGDRPGRLLAWAIAIASVGGALVGAILVLQRRPLATGPRRADGGPGPAPSAADRPASWPRTPPASPPTAPPEGPKHPPPQGRGGPQNG